MTIIGCGDKGTKAIDDPITPTEPEPVFSGSFIKTCVGACGLNNIAMAKMVADLIEISPDTIPINELNSTTTLEIVNRSPHELYIRSITITNKNEITLSELPSTSTWSTIDPNRPLTLARNAPRESQMNTSFNHYVSVAYTDNVIYFDYDFFYIVVDTVDGVIEQNQVSVNERDSIIVIPQYVLVQGNSFMYLTESVESQWGWELMTCSNISMENINTSHPNVDPLNVRETYIRDISQQAYINYISGLIRLDAVDGLNNKINAFNSTDVIDENMKYNLQSHSYWNGCRQRHEMDKMLCISIPSFDDKYNGCRNKYIDQTDITPYTDTE